MFNFQIICFVFLKCLFGGGPKSKRMRDILLSWHPNVIGWHFAANMSSFIYLFLLSLGHLTYSSVQVFSINLVICGSPSLYQNWPAQIARFSKRLRWNMSIAHFKIKMRRRGFYMNVSLKRTDRFQKSSISFCLSCNVAFVTEVLIWLQLLPGKPLYLHSNSASCWQRINLHLQVCHNTMVYCSLRYFWFSASALFDLFITANLNLFDAL